jgi:hypothetical protein
MKSYKFHVFPILRHGTICGNLINSNKLTNKQDSVQECHDALFLKCILTYMSKYVTGQEAETQTEM